MYNVYTITTAYC